MDRIPNLSQGALDHIMDRVPLVILDIVPWLPADDEGATHVVLVRRARPPFEGCWHLPGGFLGWGEDFPEAAHRILERETGLHMRSLRAIGFENYQELDPRGHQVALLFTAEVHGAPMGTPEEPVGVFDPEDLPTPIISYHPAVIQRSLWDMRGVR